MSEAKERVVIVRHPFSRIVSAYYDKFVSFTPKFESLRRRAISNFRTGGKAFIDGSSNGEKPEKKIFQVEDPQLPT